MQLPFKGYDVRGRFPEEINEELVYGAGMDLAVKSPVVVGHDCREGSKRIFKALLDGLVDGGALVYNVGEVPTPILSFTSRKANAFGIMVTASHNPPEYTGLKFFINGRNLFSEELEALKRLQGGKGEEGEVIDVDPIPHYVSKLREFFGEMGGEVCVDHGGWTGRITARILQNFVSVKEAGGERGPLPEEPPKTEKLCVSLDGDADRSMFSINGRWLNPGALLVNFARILGERKMVCDWIIPREVDKYVKTIRTRVGTPNIVFSLYNNNLSLGGELSSHFWYIPFNGHSDPVFFTLLLVKHGFSPVSMPETVSKKYLEPPEVLLRLGKQVVSPEGIEVEYLGHRVMGRRSNTEPVTRIYVQGKDPLTVLQKVEEVLGLTPA